MEKPDERASWALAGLLCAGVLCLSLRRLALGVDFTDEAYNLALPFRFVLGDRPFADEWYPHQGSALLLFPLIKLYCSIAGGTEGLVRFTREVYFLFTCGVALCIFQALRGALGGAPAALCALGYVVAIPFELPNFTYNSLGVGCFTLGLFLLARVDESERAFRRGVSAGIAHALAAVAYPTLVAAVPLAALGTACLGGDRRRRALAGYGIGLGSLLFPFAIFLAVNFKDVAQTLAYSRSIMTPAAGYGLGWGKVVALLRAFGMLSPLGHPWALAVIVLLIFLLRWLPGPAALVLAFAVPRLAVQVTPELIDGQSVHVFLLALALAAPCFFLYRDASLNLGRWMLGIWLPLAGAGALMALTSNNGVPMAGVALIGGAIVTTATLAEMSRAAARAKRVPERLQGLLALLPPVITVAVLLSFQNPPYKDAPMARLTERVESGPFRGLKTTPEKAHFLRELTRDVARLSNASGRILFYYQFPAGYLLTPMRPAIPMLWVSCDEKNRKPCIDAYLGHFDRHNLAIRMKRIFYRTYAEPEDPIAMDRDPLDRAIHAHHKLIVSRENYDIYSQTTPD